MPHLEKTATALLLSPVALTTSQLPFALLPLTAWNRQAFLIFPTGPVYSEG